MRLHSITRTPSTVHPQPATGVRRPHRRTAPAAVPAARTSPDDRALVSPGVRLHPVDLGPWDD